MGEVIAVTSDGTMIVHQMNDVKDYQYDPDNYEVARVRQRRYLLEPEILATIVRGRNIVCNAVYFTDDFVGAECRIFFLVPDGEGAYEAIAREADPSGGLFRGGSLIQIFTSLGVGEKGCSAEDVEHMDQWGLGLDPDTCGQ